MRYSIPIEENFIARQLTGTEEKTHWNLEHPQTYRQLSLFDDNFLEASPTVEDSCKTLSGQL